MTTTKFAAGTPFPPFSWPQVGGGAIAPASGDGWRLLVVYRGAHCPLCKKYLTQLNEMQKDFADAGVAVSAVSADPVDRAAAEAAEMGWTILIGAELSEDQMRRLGLYISSPRSPEETDRNFAEPGVFVINPDGATQVIDISNAPFARPDLASLLAGIRFVQGKDYPTRGMVD